MRLGRSRWKFDRRTFQLDRYTTGVPAPPKRADWTDGIKEWPMHSNDTVGNCTIAALDNSIGVWTANTHGTPAWVSDEATIAAYSAISGYVPGNEATDQGATMLDALNYFRRTGLEGHTLYAFAQVTPTNHRLMRQSIWLFGGVYCGFDLPLTAKAQSRPGGIWSNAGGGWRAKPGSWGGHAMLIQAYSKQWYWGVPWGTPDVGSIRIAPAFLARYCAEAYVMLSSQDWADHQLAPSGFDLATLEADLTALKSSKPPVLV